MNRKITNLLFFVFCFFSLITTLKAQSNIKYGDDYIVFEAEDTDTPLGGKWQIVKEGDSEYLGESFFGLKASSPAPMNKTYFQYIGPWQGAGSELEYKFTCPKTGTYQIAMRMHSPLEEYTKTGTKFNWRTLPDGTQVKWEKADAKNDFYIKMAGNFTSGSARHTESDLRTFHKLFGRGPNRWGTAINLEHNGNNGVFYNLIEGEEYTFTLKGRSSKTTVDYITFYDTSYLAHNINNQGPDLAIQLPEEIRPYESPTGIALNPSSGDIREGTSYQLNTIMTPSNGNPNATWSSSDSNIISVDQNGLITAQGTVGQKATITATSTIDNSLIATSEITVITFTAIPITSITISPEQTVIVEGDSEELSATILPSNADNKNITWSSSDETIAIVDQNGHVTGIKEGTVKIKATSDDNNLIFDESDVEISPAIPQSVSINTINGMTVEAFKTLRSNKIEIGEVLSLEIKHSNITEFNSTGFARIIVRYAINNGSVAVKPNLLVDNITVGGNETTQTVDYTVADHGTTNDPEPAVLQIFAAGNFGNINSLYSGFEIVSAGSLSIKDFNKNELRSSFYSSERDAIIIKNNINGDFSIYNLLGQSILDGKISKEINVNSLRSGIYILATKQGRLKFAK